MSTEDLKSSEDLPISFRLYEPQASQLRKLAEDAKCKSVHELARTILVLTLDHREAREGAELMQQMRGDIEEMRRALARTAEALLLNLRSDLSEEEIKKWVFEKLWPQAK